MAAKYPDQCVYDNKIFIQGIGPETNDDDLRCCLKEFTGQDPVDVQFSKSEEGACIVTFPHYVDASRLKSKSPTLHNYQLHIDEVSVSNTLCVTGLSHRLTQEKLEDYFQQITGESSICHIDFRKQDKTALITFKDGIDFGGICKKSHTVDRNKIHVEVYYKQLFEEDSGESVADVYGFSDERYRFLQKSDIIQYVKQKMQERGLNGRWEKNNGRIKTYAANDQDAVDISHILKQSIVEWKEEFDKDSFALIKSENWEEIKQRILKTAGNTVEIQFETDRPVLIVYSTDMDAGIVKEMIQNYFAECTITTTQLQSSTGTLRQLKESKQLKQIASDLKDDNIAFDISPEKRKLTITGTSPGVAKAKLKVEKLINPSVTNVEGYSVRAVLKSHPYQVIVMVGDITELEVDAIVNTTNKDLKHIGGLAKALVDKGGTEIQAECDRHVRRKGELDMSGVFCSSAGELKCQKIIHTHAPVWQDGKHNEEEELREAILTSLDAVCRLGFKSVALPALGAGVYGVPVDASTRIVVEAVKDFFKERNKTEAHTSLSIVYLCDVRSDVVSHFIDSLKTFYGKKVIDEKYHEDSTWSPLKHSTIYDRQKDQRHTLRVDRFHVEDECETMHSKWKPPDSQHKNTESLPSYQIRLLQQSRYIEKLKAKHLSVTIKIGQNWVSYGGPSSEVADTKKDMSNYLKSIITKTGHITDGQQRCLHNAGVRKYLTKKLESRGVECFSWEAEQNCLAVYAIDDRNLAATFSIIRQTVDESYIDITKENIDLISSRQWNSHVSRIRDHVQTYVDIELIKASQSLRVVTMCDNTSVVKEMIHQVLLEETTHTKRIEIPNNTGQFLKDPKQRKILKQLEQELNIVIDVDKMVLKGTEIQLEKGKKKIQKLARENNLQLTVDNRGGPMSSSVYFLGGGGLTVEEVKTFTYGKFTIVLMEGDITDLNVQAIVNSANKRLKGDTGLRRAIAEKAGPSVEQQLNKRIQQNGELDEGDFCCTSGGNLQCELIIHAVFPSWQGGTYQEKELLNATVQRCLETANSNTCSSIAFPVVGTGTCCINDNVAVRSILEAIKEFYDYTDRPYVTEVYLCCKLNKYVDLYKKKIPELFKRSRTEHTPGSSAMPTSRGSTPSTSSTAGNGWRNTAVHRALTRDDGFLELLDQPAALQYLNDKIKAKVKGRFEIEINNHVEIFAETARSASSIEGLLDQVIVHRSIAAKEPRKWNEQINTFSIDRYPGKFYAVFKNKAIDCYGTRDVMHSADFENLAATISKAGKCILL